jgi:hypothetical protein
MKCELNRRRGREERRKNKERAECDKWPEASISF